MNPIVDQSEYRDSEFDDWFGLIPRGSVPLALTVFGDWIFSYRHAIHLFSPSAARTHQIGTVAEELDWALENINERAPWVFPDLLSEMDDRRISRETNKIFHFVTPLCLNGPVTLVNLQQLDIEQYFRGMKVLLKQL